MKYCPRCETAKPPSEFYKNKRNGDGLACCCAACSRLQVAEWRRRNPEKLRAQWKRASARRDMDAHYAGVARYNAKCRERYLKLKDKPCQDCGVKYPPHVMDFDHVRGEKSFNLSSWRKVPWLSVVAEAKKCDVVCANCHRIRTHDRRPTRAGS